MKEMGILGDIKFVHPKDMQDGIIEVTDSDIPVSYTHLRAHETVLDLVCRLLLEKKKATKTDNAMIKTTLKA